MEQDRTDLGGTSTSSAVTKIRTPRSCRKRCSALPSETEPQHEMINNPDGNQDKKPESEDQTVRDAPGNEWETGSTGSTLVHDTPTPEPVDTDIEVEGSNPVDILAVETSEIASPSEETKAEEAPKRPYSAFTKNQRWMIVIISSIAGIFR